MENQSSSGGEGDNNYMIDFINILPEGCIANAVSFTSPRDACRLSLVANTFKSAAESDAVWERFLPADYHEIMRRSDDDASSQTPRKFGSKKELYLYICDNPIIIDGGTKSFSLVKWSGKKCYMLAARDLSIVWADTPRYWKWASLPDSRFPEVAELLSVCWLEISGKINTRMLSPDTIYGAYLVFKSTSGFYGFEYQPVEVSFGISGSKTETGTVYLDPEEGQRQRYQIIVPRRIGLFNHRGMNVQTPPAITGEKGEKYPKERVDGWLEVELGEYFNIGGGEDSELEMSLTEVKGGDWKSGLIVQGIEIRPKGG